MTADFQEIAILGVDFDPKALRWARQYGLSLRFGDADHATATVAATTLQNKLQGIAI